MIRKVQISRITIQSQDIKDQETMKSWTRKTRNRFVKVRIYKNNFEISLRFKINDLLKFEFIKTIFLLVEFIFREVWTDQMKKHNEGGWPIQSDGKQTNKKKMKNENWSWRVIMATNSKAMFEVSQVMTLTKICRIIKTSMGWEP
jgi:hypothetical protein